MTESKRKNPIGRLSRFDLTVLLVALALGAAVLILTILSDPGRQGPMVAYLSPAYTNTDEVRAQNIWMAPVDDPDAAVQLTDSEMGIYNFSVSPDGRYIAYAERDAETRLNELWLLSLQTGRVNRLTNCVAEDADCRTPVFREGGDVLAYERVAVNTNVSSLGPGAIRIWLLDLRTQPYTTRPLADDSQFIGHSPQWSESGTTIAFYSSDITNPGVMVYNFMPGDEDKSLKFVPSNHGTVGTLSPNGRQLIFPELTQRVEVYNDAPVQRLYTYLKIADLAELEFRDLTNPEDPIDDTAAVWHPDGQRVAIERRYTDERYTRGYQIFMLDVASGEVEPLIFDERYSHGFFEWNDSGAAMVVQRFTLTNPDGSSAVDARPEIWVKDLETGSLVLVASNAFHPRWVTP